MSKIWLVVWLGCMVSTSCWASTTLFGGLNPMKMDRQDWMASDGFAGISFSQGGIDQTLELGREDGHYYYSALGQRSLVTIANWVDIRFGMGLKNIIGDQDGKAAELVDMDSLLAQAGTEWLMTSFSSLGLYFQQGLIGETRSAIKASLSLHF